MICTCTNMIICTCTNMMICTCANMITCTCTNITCKPITYSLVTLTLNTWTHHKR